MFPPPRRPARWRIQRNHTTDTPLPLYRARCECDCRPFLSLVVFRRSRSPRLTELERTHSRRAPAWPCPPMRFPSRRPSSGSRIRRDYPDRLGQHFGLALEFNNFESERIPATHLRIFRWLAIGVLNRRNPMSHLLIGTASRPLRLRVPHLGEIRDATTALKEADGAHLRAQGGAVLVDIERRGRIGLGPKRVPGLISRSSVVGTALLVVTFGGREIEALADGHVVIEEIPGDRFGHVRVPGVYRYHIDKPGAVINPQYEGFNSFQRHEQHERRRSRKRRQPPSARHSPSDSSFTASLRRSVRIPGRRFGKIGLERRILHGDRALAEESGGAVAGAADFGAAFDIADGELMGSRCPSQETRLLCDAHAPRTPTTPSNIRTFTYFSTPVVPARRSRAGRRRAAAFPRLHLAEAHNPPCDSSCPTA